MTEKDKFSIIAGVGLAFLAWYLVKGNAPKVPPMLWRSNPITGMLEPVANPLWNSPEYHTGAGGDTSTLITELPRTGPPPIPYTSWEAYDRARVISGQTGGATGSW